MIIKTHVNNVQHVIRDNHSLIKKKTFIHGKALRHEGNIIQALHGNMDNVDNMDNEIKKELELIMLKHGITREALIIKYKEILASQHVKYRGSDVVKVLENLGKILNMDKQDDIPDRIRAVIESKDQNKITTFAIEITKKTQQYIDTLKGINK